jgi:hypothetical protein
MPRRENTHYSSSYMVDLPLFFVPLWADLWHLGTTQNLGIRGFFACSSQSREDILGGHSPSMWILPHGRYTHIICYPCIQPWCWVHAEYSMINVCFVIYQWLCEPLIQVIGLQGGALLGVAYKFPRRLSFPSATSGGIPGVAPEFSSVDDNLKSESPSNFQLYRYMQICCNS